ncbi:MAG: FHA domain-containing protein [Pyrinomonadaceae bacterium]
MPDVRLKFSGRELTPGQGVTTVGRTTENNVSFPEDSNVSRYHAEIEARGNEFCLIDLGSSNGTTINGTKVSGETYLKAGDRIMLGGTSEIVFDLADAAEAAAPEIASTAGPANLPPIDAAVSQLPSLVRSSAAAPAAPAAGSNTMLMIAGGAVLVAVAVVAVAGVVYYRSGSSACDAKAVIVKPEAGEVIFAPTEIEVETEDSSCVAKAVFTIDGEEFDSTPDAPYTVTLDPKEHPDLADGLDHNLGIILIDDDGNKIPQAGEVLLAFETRKVEKPEETKEIAPQLPPMPAGPKGKEVSIVDTLEMSNRLVKQFSGNFAYNVSNPQFLKEVQKKSLEYAQEGYFDKAAKYRDVINLAYVFEQNLDAPLGYILAMSRSKFNPVKQAGNEGLWQMRTEFVTSQKYNGVCPTESLSDPLQACAAKASAVYMKQMVYGVFDGDVIYAAAAFGKSTQDAGVWKATLPATRTDVWNSIKTASERDQIVRFFAAGIVAENPQKFGLKRDRRISELYP